LSNATISESIRTGLGIDAQPIGIAFVQEAPPGVAVNADAVPATCAFWRAAETQVFYAPADAHFNCPVGAMVMGLEMPESVQQTLMDFVKQMSECDYLDPAEASKIPSIRGEKKGVVYGPLGELPVPPDLVLLWVTPRQAMVAAEAVGTAHWTDADPTTAFGRPACAALPSALNGDRAALSLGCTGMRTFTEVSEDRMLLALPATKVEGFAASLAKALTANARMAEFYQGHKATFAP
jgi:uncharacterized protein (DUF169 family)